MILDKVSGIYSIIKFKKTSFLFKFILYPINYRNDWLIWQNSHFESSALLIINDSYISYFEAHAS